MKKLLILSLALSGCAHVEQTTCFANYDHISHILTGPPFNDTREDWIDSIGGSCRMQQGRLFIEVGSSYMLFDSGFEGDELLFNGRVAYEIWSNK